MTADPDDLAARIVEAAARAVCQERCAFMGEPACWEVLDDNGEPMGWPNVECDEPGCHAMTRAALAAAVREAGLDQRGLMLAAAMLRRSPGQFSAPGINGQPHDPVNAGAALLRALGGIADG